MWHYKLYILIVAISLLSTLGQAQRATIDNHQFMVKLNDTLLVDIFEISVARWNEFSNLHKGKFSPNDEIIEQKQYYFLFQSNEGSKMSHVTKYGMFGKMKIEVIADSLKTKSQRYKTSRLMDYPIVGISFEQAKEYCKWRTKQFNLIHFGIEDTADYLITFDLPPVSFYENYITDIDSIRSECSNFNYHCSTCQFVLKPKYQFINSGKDIVPCDSYWADKNKLYNIKGNVAEMTNEKGVAKGGSYLNYARDCIPSAIQIYNQPEPWLGFRCIAIIKE